MEGSILLQKKTSAKNVAKKESIYYLGKEIARVIHPHEISNLEFFTDNNSFLQVGIHNKTTGANVTPHAHVIEPFLIDRMEEVLFILKGKALVTLYDQMTGEIIKKVILSKGDTMIHFSEGHGVFFLRPTVLFEVKQGPFRGTKNSKICINEKTDSVLSVG